MSGDRSAPDPDWPGARWANILDRIDHRQSHVGLRYWGPPIWLEVTMTGPDADKWPAITDDSLSWDWQSSEPCMEAMDLEAAGAEDDCLVAAVGRYTIENLILNAVHEIGEWLRFDGRRVITAHPSEVARFGEPGGQGNGAVDVQVTFTPADEPAGNTTLEPRPDEVAGQRVVSRLARSAAASRFTYLAGTTISYEAAGPVVRTRAENGPATVWRGTWSRSTLEAACADADETVDLAARDVHAALVWNEADRICRAFHIDAGRCWRLAGPRPPLGADPPDSEAPGAAVLSLSIDYAHSVDPDSGAWGDRSDLGAGAVALLAPAVTQGGLDEQHHHRGFGLFVVPPMHEGQS